MGMLAQAYRSLVLLGGLVAEASPWAHSGQVGTGMNAHGSVSFSVPALRVKQEGLPCTPIPRARALWALSVSVRFTVMQKKLRLFRKSGSFIWSFLIRSFRPISLQLADGAH